jgi:hypothetical protein
MARIRNDDPLNILPVADMESRLDRDGQLITDVQPHLL